MSLLITSADERLAKGRYVKMAIFGASGSGKTSQARTLDPETTLFIDFEAGTLALDDWGGDVINVRTQANALGVHPWELSRALACVLCGADPAAGPLSAYSADMYEKYLKSLGGVEQFKKYETVFVDSITVASRMAFSWSQTRPEAFSEKTGKPDNRGAYGLLGQEMMQWLAQLQHIPDKNVILVGILDVVRDPDIPGRIEFKPQVEGGKASRELPGIFDQIATLSLFKSDEGEFKFDVDKGTERAFVCKSPNPFGVPAKDRSGRLEGLEAPDLGALLKKLAEGKRTDALQTQTQVTKENTQ